MTLPLQTGPVEAIKAQALDLEVPPEVVIANDILEAYRNILEYGRWVNTYFATATSESKDYRLQKLRDDLVKLDVAIRMMLQITEERYA